MAREVRRRLAVRRPRRLGPRRVCQRARASAARARPCATVSVAGPRTWARSVGRTCARTCSASIHQTVVSPVISDRAGTSRPGRDESFVLEAAVVSAVSVGPAALGIRLDETPGGVLVSGHTSGRVVLLEFRYRAGSRPGTERGNARAVWADRHTRCFGTDPPRPVRQTGIVGNRYRGFESLSLRSNRDQGIRRTPLVPWSRFHTSPPVP